MLHDLRNRAPAAPFENRAAEFRVRVTTPRVYDKRHVLDAVVDLVARGVLRPQICARTRLGEAAEAHRRLEANAVTRGRIVLPIPPAGVVA